RVGYRIKPHSAQNALKYGWFETRRAANRTIRARVRVAAPQVSRPPHFPRGSRLRRSAYTDRHSNRKAAMSPLKHSNHLAARMGRWSASHWKTAVFGWLILVVALFYVGNKVGLKTIATTDSNVGQAHKADNIFKHSAFKQTDPQTELVLIQSKTLTVGAPAFRATVQDVVRSVEGHPGMKNLRSPYTAGNDDQISQDKHSALVTWEMKGKYEAAKKRIDPLTAATAAVATRHPAFYVGEAGSISSGKALDA